MRPVTETVFLPLRCQVCRRWTPHRKTTMRDLDHVSVNTRCNICGTVTGGSN